MAENIESPLPNHFFTRELPMANSDEKIDTSPSTSSLIMCRWLHHQFEWGSSYYQPFSSPTMQGSTKANHSTLSYMHVFCYLPYQSNAPTSRPSPVATLNYCLLESTSKCNLGQSCIVSAHLHVWCERISDKSGKIRLLTPESRWLYKVPK